MTHRRIGAYAGIDPTAPSLHVGHMIPFMALGWLYIHGYKANFVVSYSMRLGYDQPQTLTRASLEDLQPASVILSVA